MTGGSDKESKVMRNVFKSRAVHILLILTGSLILCAGCGKRESADTAWRGNGGADGNKTMSQEGNVGDNGNKTASLGGNGEKDGNEAESQTGNAQTGDRQELRNPESTNPDGVRTGTGAGEEIGQKTFVPEEMLSYEKSNDQGVGYLVITGVAEENREIFIKKMADMEESRYGGACLRIPEEIDGIPVREIGEEAFADIGMRQVVFPDTVTVIGDGAFRNTGIRRLLLPPGLEIIGAGAFENCCLERVMFPDLPVTVGDRGFAGNKDLWTALVPNVETTLGNGVFADCSGQFLLCYGDNPEGKDNLVDGYAQENSLDSVEIILSKEPIVHYYEEPPVLRPRISNFFYGVDGDEEKGQWCTWEYDETAPNFGYDDWQWLGCSSWCGVMDFGLEAEGSSELAPGDGRYSADNVLEQSRMAAWAEGVEGYGIGESITYRQFCTCFVDNKWEAMGPEYREPVVDGFMRYTEICIVNGYAKNQKTWEENGRIKTLLMYVEDELYARLELEDTILPQYFTLPEDDIKVLNGGVLEARFEIAEVYPGSVYEDTCLTGLVMEFSGRYAH